MPSESVSSDAVIPFAPRRFQSAASVYLAGRPAYSARLFRRLAAWCGLEQQHGVLDLGCGPGQIAIALAPYAGRVVGLDPEPDMLAIARDSAEAAGLDIDWIEGSSYDLSPTLGRFHLVTMGRSFHWMDRVDTLKRLDGMTEPGGAVVLMGDTHPAVPDNGWYQPYQAIIERFATNQAEKKIRADWVSHEGVLLASPFASLDQIAVFERRQIDIETLVLRAHSMSSTAPARLGARADELAAAIRVEMAPFAANGLLTEIVSSTALIATRP
ncbi:methyltransferase domain-containing protein [Kaistia dalseonensis]|uniref:SAM-dependent methyltransferase n=1 Tax=Kaistia dalseonensis TaxID=410840 RepID=A0ABU0H1R9_9HYPH|nr:methyltransferase domain-containing protein [Kaistia dalseonensis]MCX5493281.1 methyltransferase domain-containing protein [Kaistia dalseonensis]MDQ0435838.1 SAM-dependent methyltransferase [Kaistia dalseonensis]